MPNMEAILEADKRGILPDKYKAPLEEARKRGLIPNEGPRPITQDLFGQVLRGETEFSQQELDIMNTRQDKFQAQAQPIVGGLVGGTAGLLGKGILSAASLGGLGGAAGEETTSVGS
jgi:hypothetical protein